MYNQTIELNYLTRANNTLKKCIEANKYGQSGSTSFLEKVAEKSAEHESVGKAERTENVNTKDMSMEEYKEYIHEQISSFPMSATRLMESTSITISEAGFEAMKNDQEYEEWVLNDLRTGFLQTNPWVPICGGGYVVIYYGATKEECHVESWYPGYQNGNGANLFHEKSKDSFWDRRVEQRKKLAKEYKAFQEKKAIAKEMQKKQAYTELILKKKNKKHMPLVYPVYDIESLLKMLGE